jgi:neutral amino acid transport system substrate-binding protein
VAACALALAMGACAPAKQESTAGTIAVGALLPFTGKEAALGRNLEQALLLAVHDVNAAGGIGGQKLRLVTRDSNSGSERGFNQLLQLLYTDQVQYLIGPEETDLANAIVPDVKGLNILDILPGYEAPSIEHPGNAGGWIRLAPTTNALGCAMGKQVVRDGAVSVNALVADDDYNGSLASDFLGHVTAVGGRPLPSVIVSSGESSYAKDLGRVLDFGADVTLLTVPPESAATIVTEWTVAGRRGGWYMSPLLRTDVLLENIPFGTLDGVNGLSPSSSLASECTAIDPLPKPAAAAPGAPDGGVTSGAGGGPGSADAGASDASVEAAGGAGDATNAPAMLDPGHDALDCTHNNANAFTAHFAEYWQGDKPFAASNFYYDAVVLLALGLNKGLAEEGELPTTRELQADIRELGNPSAQPVRWNNLREPLTEVRLGTDVRYVGAAAEYAFDAYGAAQQTVFDTWTIANDGFVVTGTFEPVCPQAQ